MSPTTVKWQPALSSKRRHRLLLATLALTAASTSLGIPSTAEAGGFLGARFGADHGTPVGRNPFSIYFNPAAIGATKGTQLSIDAAVIYRRASYERSSKDLSPVVLANTPKDSPSYKDYEKSNTGKATISNILALPFAGIVTDLGNNKLPIRLGYGVYIPFGGLASWTRNTDFTNTTAPGGNDGPQRWFNISGRIISLYNTVALSVNVPGTKLSFGANGSLVHHTVETARARNTNGSDDTASQDGTLLEGRALVDARGFNAAAAVGVFYEAIPEKLSIGASYSIRPGFGQMRLKGTLRSQFGQERRANDTEQVELLQTYPDVYRLGMAYRVTESVELRLDGEYVTWSNFKRQCLVNANQNAKCLLYDDGSEVKGNDKVIQVIERNWVDGWAVRFGTGYFLSEQTELFGSALYDASAVPDETLDPTIIDSGKIHWVAGVRQLITPKFALASSFNHVYFFERDTTGKNVFFTRRGESRQPSAGGVYNQQFFYLNINGTYTF
ncbi:MAG: outer membrane protein transport protein [Myxococcales bacterium]|nr:outer membrane protein transport protein [Polyangiaceae bacterium]MDW8248339.1 outer membrane protein transport protein [Myxococcales bacterium]